MKKIVGILILLIAFYSNAQDSTATKIIVDGRVFNVVGAGGNPFDQLILNGSTSGQATITAPAVAGTPTITLPTTSLDMDVLVSDVATNSAKTSNANHTGDVTGATTLTIAALAVETGMIANDAVDDDKLKTANTAVDEYGVTYESATGNFAYEPIINGDITDETRTSTTPITQMAIQSLANYNTDGAPGAGRIVFVDNASPAEVIATATITMDGWKMYDDQTADAATITLSDCQPGEQLTVYINRASAPTLAGTGLTFSLLPNTTTFASVTNLPAAIFFEVAYDGTTIDYYYFERN